jgi:NADH-quinone oxidoreductase subunit G
MSKKLIKCEINNQEIEVPEGTSVIEAFKKLDQPIAHYCWHPGLSVAGVCRLCMVDIEGIPKLQIACNTEIKEGMKVSNQSEKVKEAVKWGLEFHLINHPLDCPICDQAGECELQEQYMHFGQYSPNMAERKVKKRKVVDLGSKIVLDTERCILCSRCVRFTDEVSKTHELGIFNRGDKSEIGIFKDKPLENEYAVNTVDICPVGALTSKDFSFRQRVWYLKTADSICTGCSTGCNIKIDYNEEGLFRVQPRYNKEVNGYWMCDKGREVYRLPNKEGRLLEAKVPSAYSFEKADSLNSSREVRPSRTSGNPASSINVLKKIKDLFVKKEDSGSALILTAQYTVEEYEDLISFFIKYLGTQQDIYYWRNNPESFDDFDGLLLRGDKNPNTKGLLEVLTNQGAVHSWESLQNRLAQKEIKVLWVAGPENQKVYPDIKEKINIFESYCDSIIWWTAHPLSDSQKIWQIPTKTFFEKEGTFINQTGRVQKIKAVHQLVPSALSLSESVALLKGEELKQPEPPFLVAPMKTNHFTHKKKVL